MTPEGEEAIARLDAVPVVIRSGQTDGPDDSQTTVTVRLLGVPLQLWERLSIHTAELLREFALIVGGDNSAGSSAPQRLLDLVADLNTRYAGTDTSPEERRDAALQAGRTTLDLEYEAVPSTAQACRDLLERMAEADEYCRDEQLLTLATPGDQVAFRTWYLLEFIRQIDGHEPRRWEGPLA